jgi:hypothetical protein
MSSEKGLPTLPSLRCCNAGKPAPMKRNAVCPVFSQTTDAEGKVNGLMTYDRNFIKVVRRYYAK